MNTADSLMPGGEADGRAADGRAQVAKAGRGPVAEPVTGLAAGPVAEPVPGTATATRRWLATCRWLRP